MIPYRPCISGGDLKAKLYFFFLTTLFFRAVDVDITDGTLPPLTEPPNATAILDKMFFNYDKRLRPMYGGKIDSQVIQK